MAQMGGDDIATVLPRWTLRGLVGPPPKPRR